MTEPELTPRLEQVRALLQAIRGSETATLEQVEQYLSQLSLIASQDLPVQQEIRAILTALTSSDGAPGFPPEGPVYLKDLWARLEALRSIVDERTASQVAGDEASVTSAARLLQALLLLDDILTNTGALVSNQVQRSAWEVSDLAIRGTLASISTSLTQLNLTAAAINAKLTETNSTLGELLICCQAGDGPVPLVQPACLPSGAAQGEGIEFVEANFAYQSELWDVYTIGFPEDLTAQGIYTLVDGNSARRKYKPTSEGDWEISFGTRFAAELPLARFLVASPTYPGSPADPFPDLGNQVYSDLSIGTLNASCDSAIGDNFDGVEPLTAGDEYVELLIFVGAGMAAPDPQRFWVIRGGNIG